MPVTIIRKPRNGPSTGVWTDAALTAIYSLTPLHFGIGQAAAAVDLPIAREAGSNFPLLPATGLKGVARDFLGPNARDDKGVLAKAELERLFGPEIGNGEAEKSLSAGALTFGEARLVAYPVRSLNRPFLHVTCPLIVERLARDLRAVEVNMDLVPAGWVPQVQPGQALLASREHTGAALVLEDLCYLAGETAHSQELADFADKLADLLPAEETATRQRLRAGLVLIPDADFNDLMARVVPVRARIKLTSGKTTGKWPDPRTGPESGNLWYEEHLPPDCLFLALVGERRERVRGGDAKGADVPALKVLRDHAEALKVVQIGGNETVGYGLCWWSGWSEGAK